MTETEIHEIKTPQQRSPAYPYIALDKAEARIRQIHSQIHDHPQPREILAKALGRPAKSSATIQTLATLSQYGLLENVSEGGARKMQVTALAREIVHPYAPADKVEAARKIAAQSPAVFKEIWGRFGDSKKYGDDVLLYYLTHDRQTDYGSVFTEKAASEVLRIYRTTMEYAGLSDSDKGAEEETLSADKPDTDERTSEDGKPEDKSGQRSNAGSEKRSFEMGVGERELQTGMLSKNASYRVVVSGKIGVKEIERLIAKLELDKEILADDDEDAGEAFKP